jgi:hypothetical protein
MTTVPLMRGTPDARRYDFSFIQGGSATAGRRIRNDSPSTIHPIALIEPTTI